MERIVARRTIHKKGPIQVTTHRNETSSSGVLLVSADLMVASELEGVARREGATWRQIRPDQPINQLTSVNLAVIDLAALTVDQLKMLVNTMQDHGIFTLAFGAHVQAQRLALARQMGCDRVVTRGSISAELRTAITSGR